MQRQPVKIISPEEARLRWLKSFQPRDSKKHFSSGFKKHDQVAGKLLRGYMYVVAARPGVGKTAFLVAMARRLALDSIRVIYASLEIPIERLWNRLACLHDSNFTLRELNESADNPTPEYLQRLDNLSRQIVNFSPIFFENKDFAAFLETVSQIIEPSSDYCVIIDYAGLFMLKGLDPSQRYWLMSEVAKQLGILARELDIPVVTGVQFNRAIENRKEKSPQLSDLRDTGEWENHSRGVWMLTRENQDELDVYIRKNTEGGANDVYYSLHFDGPRVAVEEYD